MKLLIVLCSFLYSYGPDIQAASKRCWKLSHGSVTFTLLIDASSPGGSALPPQGQISAAHLRRRGTQEPQPNTPSPPACPPLRASRSPLGILPREPPYYGATKLRSLPSPPLFSTSFSPSLAPSLPRISSSPSVASPAPFHPSISAHRWVGTNSRPIGRRGLHLLTAPYRYPRPPRERERRAVKKKKKKMEEDGMTAK